MYNYPERINISPVNRQRREDDFYLVDRSAFPGKGTEYIHTDLAQAELQAAVAAEREAIVQMIQNAFPTNTDEDITCDLIANEIRARQRIADLKRGQVDG